MSVVWAALSVGLCYRGPETHMGATWSWAWPPCGEETDPEGQHSASAPGSCWAGWGRTLISWGPTPILGMRDQGADSGCALSGGGGRTVSLEGWNYSCHPFAWLWHSPQHLRCREKANSDSMLETFFDLLFVKQVDFALIIIIILSGLPGGPGPPAGL